MILIKNPCNKCLVKPACTVLCENYFEYIKTIARIKVFFGKLFDIFIGRPVGMLCSLITFVLEFIIAIILTVLVVGAIATSIFSIIWIFHNSIIWLGQL